MGVCGGGLCLDAALAWTFFGDGYCGHTHAESWGFVEQQRGTDPQRGRQLPLNTQPHTNARTSGKEMRGWL
jgi:hypothetical protein